MFGHSKFQNFLKKGHNSEPKIVLRKLTHIYKKIMQVLCKVARWVREAKCQVVNL